MDTEKIKEIIKTSGMQIKEVAELMEIDRVTLWRKINGKTDFCLREIICLKKTFGEEIVDAIFFNQ